MSKYKTTIGLEIHVQLLTKTKAFCSCSANAFESEPNTNICPVCTGQPGALPVFNEEALKLGIKAAIALNAKINEYSRFDRKNYFYPDLPKGYQITQYFYPLANDGYIEIEGKKIRIERMHLEEDSGKMFHEGEKLESASYSLVDYNRSGIPLIEIVTKPDIESPKEARLFMEKLRNILRYAEISTGDMEKGALRCDANISITNTETGFQSNRVEVKNINSFKFVEKALEYERERIIQHLEEGKNVPMETRGWNFATRSTFSMRSKEEEADYRYFPEPDIPPVIVTEKDIEEVKKTMPEMIDEKKERFIKEYTIKEYDAEILASDKELADYFEKCAKLVKNPQFVSNFIITDLLREMNKNNIELKDIKVSPEHFKELEELIDSGKISTKIAKEIFIDVFETGKSPADIVKEKGLEQIDDDETLKEIIKKIIENNPKQVQQYKNGKTKLLGFFVGQLMKETKGKANPQKANKLVKEMLEE
ncbi:glutamyl-tRNA amidotransferase [Marinitoga sp. 1135]|uniref:Aspartyl/glutamyl-tRNA(Asn/Gln) amidotransferase subunit B n=1 Tax=Marinitoga piezophila (strain DSM 14283 / JCM 11233 / KA3) TaxID=443254 RepID=H2J2Y0_MARPK|nr:MULTISPECIES: Asp-tRNA(Asn)/Glu-tRNA(Gln) amidotransferase subunit GatB [Marinitoga]AEX85671.1 glutamyl-tRNA(Gln) and/or aspartyl-tRNA(Asn) amidotransferase, B subunit [Marinitoga piezophila KA3]APT76122.1 glutamyl-tRNA amidotransferase [Marinitoga sp. 1137]NUU95872.1 glutamyl-tRNA amidotransferase [Marinitoga sp. 1135]NUU97787.1 glutamyl-tRNA amidotransferase [Marinitoga sp. 1138]